MRFIRFIGEITFDAFNNIIYFIQNNLILFANILNMILPYLMYFLGQALVVERNEVAVGGEIFIPTLFIIMIYYLKSSANKLGKGITIPIPDKRFTEVDDDGEVSVEHKRIQELLLYVADLEDWMERKGLIE